MATEFFLIGDSSTNTNSGTITTGGANGIGLYSTGATSTLTNSGTLTTNGTNGYGLYSTGTTSTLTNSGTLTTNGTNGYGLYSTGATSTLTNSGTLTTSGQYGYGLYSDGASNILTNSGTLTTSGQYGYGLRSAGTTSTLTNSGTITTSGANSAGLYSLGSSSTLTNSGTIITSGTSSYGLHSIDTANILTNSGTVATSGTNGYGLYSSGTTSTLTNSGTITTGGANGIGLYSTGSTSTLTNSGTITTSGQASYGMNASRTGNTLTNSGTITTSGTNGYGLRSTGGTNILTNSGTITTSGTSGHGIYAAGASSTLTNSGTIRVTGSDSKAIYVAEPATNTTVNFHRGSVIVGDIFADNAASGARLNLKLGAGASYAYAVTGSTWTLSDLDHRPMVAGSAYAAAGVGNITTAAQSLYERTVQLTQSLDHRIRAHHQNHNNDGAYWLDTYHSDSSRASDGHAGLEGAKLNFNQYRSGITAGIPINNHVTPMEVVVNYERGQLNIDNGNQGIESNAVMAGVLFPNIHQVLGGTVGAKILMGYSDFAGDRKVLDNLDSAGWRNVTAHYHSMQVNMGSAWNATLYQSGKVAVDTLVGMDVNTQHLTAYNESDLFRWHARTLHQLQERAEISLTLQPLENPLTLYGRAGIANRNLLSGENQDYTIHNTEVSYKDANQRNTYGTVNAGASYPVTTTIQAYTQINYYDSTKNIHAMAMSIGIAGTY